MSRASEGVNRAHLAYHHLKLALNQEGVIIVGEGVHRLSLEYRSEDRHTLYARAENDGLYATEITPAPSPFIERLIDAHIALYRALYCHEGEPIEAAHQLHAA